MPYPSWKNAWRKSIKLAASLARCFLLEAFLARASSLAQAAGKLGQSWLAAL
jgi:hypothetical protein